MSAYPPPRLQQPFIFNPREFYDDTPITSGGSTEPTTEIIAVEAQIDPNKDVTFMSGSLTAQHELPSSTIAGLSKTIVNLNYNVFKRVMSNRNSFIESTGIVYAVSRTAIFGELIVGGSFGNVIRNGVAVPNTANLFKLDLPSGNITSLGTSPNGIVYAIEPDN